MASETVVVLREDLEFILASLSRKATPHMASILRLRKMLVKE